jgi:sodium-dependent dicarboxylate transporter 2/3/5
MAGISWRILLGPVASLVVWHLASELPPPARKLAAVAALTLWWWITEAVPPAVAALAGSTMALLLGVASGEKIFAPYAHPVIFFFMGSFFLAKAIEVHRVDTFLLDKLMRVPGIRGRARASLAAIIVLTACVSMFLSNAATTALLLPLALGLASKAVVDSDAKARFMMAFAWASSVGGFMTPFGTAPNMISLGLLKRTTGIEVSFLEWISRAMPLGAVCLVILVLLGVWRVPAAKIRFEAPAERKEIRADRRVIALVLLAATLLVAPPFLPGLSKIDETAAMLIPSLLLFLIGDGSGKRPLLKWNEAATIDWQCLLLFGGGLSLGALLFDTGLAQQLGNALAPLASNPKVFIVGTALVTLALTEVASNTATVNMLVPVVIAVSQAAGLDARETVATTAIAASLGSMLPVGTPPNALVYGTGLVPARKMALLGGLFDLAAVTLLIFTFLLRV